MVVVRVVALASRAVLKSRNMKIPFFFSSSLGDVMCKALGQDLAFRPVDGTKRFPLEGHRWIHFVPFLNSAEKVVEAVNHSERSTTADGAGDAKVKRRKLKGKREVVRWLKFFRWKKKKEYQRMTAEEKILYKLKKARKKEERIVEALKKIEPADSSETTHDPEILTPEEHFFFLKMGLKCKNYVPVGRRGIYQGVILNMHLHWKKHQTLQVVVKTFTPDEVKEIAAELARLTGGIVLDIHEENTIIMYRGKNYSQPPTEIMSPRVTLQRKKALDKSKYRDGLRAVRKYIPRLEQELELLQAQAKSKPDTGIDTVEETQEFAIDGVDPRSISGTQFETSDKLKETIDRSKECSEDDLTTDALMASDSEDLSDIFETDSGTETEEKVERPLYLEEFEKFPVENDGEPEDFDEHLRQISADSKKAKTLETDVDSPNFDEVDRMFLRAASLLKKKRR
ncbi:CRS1_YhbY domain-containing protein [Cephalotus follicularis]|uniref:CRS1_YhbY domain-containing protein n=1 Tax=Cephalotus follicularis TaxID=3775 RepID=A0A1Q3C8D2_CEPFO|nr:CRS1_YhbY domain-containing protein [Cephalotus follicularis]